MIFLVVFGHSLEVYKDKSIIIQSIYMFIYLFHMPVFIFVSGYFSKDVDKCRSKAFRNFFVPYLIFNVIWNLVSIPVVGAENFSITTPGWALWYLMSMFFWRISLKDLIKVKYIFPISFIIGITAGLSNDFDTFLSLSRTLFFLPFFLGGYYTSEKKLLSFKKGNYLLSMSIIIVTMIIAIMLAYLEVFPTEFLYGSHAYNTFSITLWLAILGRMSVYIIGFAFVYVMINLITPTKTFYSKIGLNTFSVYILHPYLVAVVFAINSFIPDIFIQVVICIVTSILITYLLSRNIVMKNFTNSINWVVSRFEHEPKEV